MAQKDFEALYELLATDVLDEDSKGELEEEMSVLAREMMHDRMVEGFPFDFTHKQEHFILRVLYDNALTLFESDERYEARETFAMLAAASSSKLFEKSMKKHLLALDSGLSFETFIDEWIADKVPKQFFASKFTKIVEKNYKIERERLNLSIQAYVKLFKQG